MQSRGADERPSRLSLLPVVRDLDEAVAGQPAAPPPGPQSQMEWDEEEEAVAPPRSQNKVRQRVREVMYRRKAAAASAVQHVNSSDVKTPEQRPPIPVSEKHRTGSVRNARIGIEKRRQYEVCLPLFILVISLTKSQLSSLRAYDELMSPVAFAHQRALPKKIVTKHQQQEPSWPRKLKEKTSTRSLKSKASFSGLKKLGGSSPSLRQTATSPMTPHESPALGGLTPPVPPIPMRYVEGSQESIPRPSPFGSAIMPALGVDARVRPSTANKGHTTPPTLKDLNEISPFLAYEDLAPGAATPRTPPPRLTPSLRVPSSTTTLNTLRTSPSREFPSGPEDPFWDEAVARVEATVRRDQEQERRERKALDKAAQQVIRNISKDRDGRLKWAKLTIESLVGKYDEHGWLPKKDPKEFDDEDWTFVLEVLNHKDTKALRDRLFRRPEWIEADKTRREKYEEEMRTNPTPEYLAAQKAKDDKERKEYGFRKVLGLLTAEELEAERQKDSPPVGLGISSATEPVTPLTASTTQTGENTDHSAPSEGTNEPECRGRQANRSEHEETPSRRKGHKHGISSVARHSVEQMTDVFNTESFNPRLSILGSEEIKQYIKKNPPIRPSPPTPTPGPSRFNTSLDPRQGSEPGSSPGLWLSSKHAPAQRLRHVKKAASSNDLIEEYNRQQFARTGIQPSESTESPKLPTLGIHPALRSPDNATVATSRPAVGSQIPRLRKAASSVAPLNGSATTDSIRCSIISASPPSLATTPALQRPPKPRKPSTAVKLPGKPALTTKLPSEPSTTAKLPSEPLATAKLPSKPTTTVKVPRKPTATPPSSASRLSPVHELQEVGVDTSPKIPPLVRKPSTSVKSPSSKARSCRQSSFDAQLQAPSYPCPSPSTTARSQKSAISSHSHHSQSSGQSVSSPPPLKYSRPSASSVAGFFNRFSNDARLAYSPLPLSYSRPSPSAAVDSGTKSPPDRQPDTSPLPLSSSHASSTAVAGSDDQSSADRNHVPTPLLLNYSRHSPPASDGTYIQSSPDEGHVISPEGIAYAVLPLRPVVHSSSEIPSGGQPVSSPQEIGYSDPLPSTAIIPFTTFVANNGADEHEYELFAPVPLPEHLPPRSMARLSRVPTFPDACDFLAVMEDEPDGPYELPATPVRSTTPVRATTPMDRLNAKRSGIPVATGSKVADTVITNARGDQGAASFSPSAFNVGPYFPSKRTPTSLQFVRNTGQKQEASPPPHNVRSSSLSSPVNLQSVSTTVQREESSPIFNVGPYFPPGPVSFGLDQNTGASTVVPTKPHNVSLHALPGQLTFQSHQTTSDKVKAPVLPAQIPNVANNTLTPSEVAMAEWRNYQEKEPLVQYRGDRFEAMVRPSGTKSTIEQAQRQPQHHGSHFEIMVDSSSTTCLPDQARVQSQHHGNHFEIMVDTSDPHQLATEQPQASSGRSDADLPATPHTHNPTVTESHVEGNSSSAQLSHASKGELMSKQLRFASSSPGREQRSPPLPALLSSKIPSFRSFSDNNPSPSPRQPATQAERSISLGGPQSGSPFTRNDGTISDTGRLAKKFESMKYNVSATAPLRQGRFESFTPTKIRSPPTEGGNAPISTRSRLRTKLSSVFHTDPVEQHEFGQDQQSTSGNAGALDVNIEDVISAWQSSSPVPVQSPAPFQNQEIQSLRAEIGLEPIGGHVLGEQKHPNHTYCWNTKKIMCRRIHNQGYILPSLPSSAPGLKAHMADRASELFVGIPYTDESAEAQRCYSCKSCCCRFAELSAQSKEPSTNDIVALNQCRQAEETVTSLRSRKPNGVEEWDSFLKCSQCEHSYCPDCIRLCGEVLCQQPVCKDCVDSTELCPIHNMF